VLKEDLTVRFGPIGAPQRSPRRRCLGDGGYTIENRTKEEIQVDFGFPILRGIYLIHGMVTFPDVHVTIDKEYARTTVIANSAIYGMIAERPRGDRKGIARPELARLVAAVREASYVKVEPVQKANLPKRTGKRSDMRNTSVPCQPFPRRSRDRCRAPSMLRAHEPTVLSAGETPMEDRDAPCWSSMRASTWARCEARRATVGQLVYMARSSRH